MTPRVPAGSHQQAGSALEWTSSGFLMAADGTEYAVQREQTNGAQSGGLIYYLLRRRPGEHSLTTVREIDTTRGRAAAVKKIAERMVRAQNDEVSHGSAEKKL